MDITSLTKVAPARDGPYETRATSSMFLMSLLLEIGVEVECSLLLVFPVPPRNFRFVVVVVVLVAESLARVSKLNEAPNN